MARIKYSALVSDMRNKLNGSVLSKNRAGSYVRNKTTPVNPQTQYQQAVRQRLGALSSEWGALTTPQRGSWISSTSNFPYTDIFGDKKELDGKSLFVKLNMNLANIGSPTINVAPMPVGIPVFGVTSAVLVIGVGALDEFLLNMSGTTVPAGFTLAVYATPGIKPGVSFVKNKFRYLGTATVAAGIADVLDIWTERFDGQIAAGETIHVRVALVSTTGGQMGVPTGLAASGS